LPSRPTVCSGGRRGLMGEPWVSPCCPHGALAPPDFESGASASSATSARTKSNPVGSPTRLAELGKTAASAQLVFTPCGTSETWEAAQYHAFPLSL